MGQGVWAQGLGPSAAINHINHIILSCCEGLPPLLLFAVVAVAAAVAVVVGVAVNIAGSVFVAGAVLLLVLSLLLMPSLPPPPGLCKVGPRKDSKTNDSSKTMGLTTKRS